MGILFDDVPNNIKSLLHYVDADFEQYLDKRKFKTMCMFTLDDGCTS